MRRGLCVVAVLLIGVGARADGMFSLLKGGSAQLLYQQELSAVTPRQRAAILRTDDGRERLILEPAYRGPAAEFAWIIPVPGLPAGTDLEVGPPGFVEGMLRATEPRIETVIHAPPEGGAFGLKGMGAPAPPSAAAPSSAPGVTVHTQKDVGQYHAAVLSAREAGALERWLQQNGYHVPAELDSALRPYVERQWYFVALKLRANWSDRRQRDFDQPRPPADHGLVDYDLEPLSITFATKRLVYPLALTKLSSGPRLSLLLVVVDDQPVRASDLATVCPREAVELPLGSLYGTYRRQVTSAPEGALLREAVVTETQRQALSAQAPHWGPPPPALPSIAADGYTTRFFAWVEREKMQDLYFEPDPAAPAYVTLVRREAWPAVPLWIRLTAPPWLLLASLVAVVALLGLAWWRSGRGWSRAVLLLTALAFPVIIAALVAASRGPHLLTRAWREEALADFPVWAWTALFGLLAVLLLLAAQRFQVRREALLLAALAGCVVVAGVRVGDLRLRHYHGPRLAYRYSVDRAQDQLASFLAQAGGYPMSAAQLFGRAPGEQGQDASGNPTPLATVTYPRGSGVPLEDPLTGSEATWVVDPLDPAGVDSGGFEVTVSTITPEEAARRGKEAKGL